MRTKFSVCSLLTLALLATGTLFTPRGIAQETVLHNFDENGHDGAFPPGGVTRDAAGNLYGAAGYGGSYGYGAVFELAPQGNGLYTEKILHSFNLISTDGIYPYSGVILDSAGNIYGTTSGDGGPDACGTYNCGTVYELVRQTNGEFKERIIHAFQNDGVDGNNPLAGLALDAAGNLYGTTQLGGTLGQGTVFELIPKSGGWTERILYSFDDLISHTDGEQPRAPLAFSPAGTLIGTTTQGGRTNNGTLFELTQTAGGWTETVIHSFTLGEGDGAAPSAGVTFDASGNFYGTTGAGGAYGYGMVYEFVAQAGGGYRETILHSFANGTDGNEPYGGVVFDASGNLYGTTVTGGSYSNGTLFKLTPRSGVWTETILCSFATGGYNPDGNIALDSSGNVYGTTQFGGSGLAGVAYEVRQ
jgi:uncharacterized repeat protein (TIGR03803 family)